MLLVLRAWPGKKLRQGGVEFRVNRALESGNLGGILTGLSTRTDFHCQRRSYLIDFKLQHAAEAHYHCVNRYMTCTDCNALHVLRCK